MLPRPELDTFLLAVQEAADLALSGDATAGDECLLIAKQRTLERENTA